MTAPPKLPSHLKLVNGTDIAFGTDVSSDQDGAKTRDVSMLLYSGAPVDIGFGWRMIVDLEGLSLPKGRIPIQANHKWEQQVGFGKAEKTAKELNVKGKAILGFAATQQILTGVDGGYRYQASMGLSIQKTAFVSREDEPETVNGRQFSGPGIVIKKSRLTEASIVPAGADSDTSTALLADNGEVFMFDGEPEMSEPKTDFIAEFSAKYPEQVEKWRAEGHARGLAELANRFTALSEKFADRPGFIVEQFKKGNDLTKATAEFADILQAELKTTRQKLDETEKKMASSGGSDGVQFASPETKPSAPALSPATTVDWGIKAKEMWKTNDQNVQDLFATEEGLALSLRNGGFEALKKQYETKAA